MSERRYTSFEAFWPYYVREHSKPWTRRFHFAGTSAALACLAAIARRPSRLPVLLPAALVAGYGPAWVSHFFIEKNRPATFTYPLWSLLADFKMYGLIASGRMDAEVARVLAAYEAEQREAAQPEPPSAVAATAPRRGPDPLAN